MLWTAPTIEVLAEAITHIINVALMAYLIRTTTRESFEYLNHRLDVLGKDAFVFYPRDRYRSPEEGAPPTEDGSILSLRETEPR